MYVVHKQVLFIYQMSGVFPLIYSSDKSTPYGNIVFSPCLFIYGLVMAAAQTISTYWVLYITILEKPIPNTSRTSIVSTSLHSLSINLFFAAAFMNSARRYYKFIDMYRILEKVNQALEKNVFISKTALKVSLIAINTLIWVLLSVLYNIWLCHQYKGCLGVIAIPSVVIANTAVVGLVIQFTFINQSISKRFKAINHKLERAVLNQLYRGSQWDPLLPHVNVISEDAPAMSRIKDLRDIYWLLCGAVNKANAFYSCQLLALVTTLFFQITISSYYLLRDIWLLGTPKNVSYVLLHLVWVLTHSFHLILVAWTSTNVAYSADQTRIVVCKLLNKGISKELKDQLVSFLSQLPHKNVEFSAMGFFPMNNHILTLIAGSVVTYLVILIQFHITSSG